MDVTNKLRDSGYPRATRWLRALDSGHYRAVAREMDADAQGDWPGVEHWRGRLTAWSAELHERHQWLAQNENRGSLKGSRGGSRRKQAVSS